MKFQCNYYSRTSQLQDLFHNLTQLVYKNCCIEYAGNSIRLFYINYNFNFNSGKLS